MKKIFGTLFFILGILLLAFAQVYQMILMYEKTGMLYLGEDWFVPHWSAWFYLIGAVPIFTGIYLLNTSSNNSIGRWLY